MYLKGAGGFSHGPACFELEMNEKFSLKLLSPIQNTLLLMESNIGRGKGKESIPTGLNVIPVRCRQPGLFLGLGICLD